MANNWDGIRTGQQRVAFQSVTTQQPAKEETGWTTSH